MPHSQRRNVKWISNGQRDLETVPEKLSLSHQDFLNGSPKLTLVVGALLYWVRFIHPPVITWRFSACKVV